MADGLTVAFVGFAAAMVGGLLQAWSSRSFERQRFFRDNKREVYGSYLSALATLSQRQSLEPEHVQARTSVVEARCKIALYGSADVIATVGRVFAHPDLSSPEAQGDLRAAIEAMRRDTGLTADASQSASLNDLLFTSSNAGSLR